MKRRRDLKRQGRRSQLLGIVVAGLAAGTAFARLAGYRVGGRTIVRCRKGHLFTTVWIPGASLKAVRLGWWRFQRCPVGRHWTLVAPVRESSLTPAELAAARSQRDVAIP